MNDEIKQRFSDWLNTPKHKRQPKTQRELAKELGLKEVQLSILKRSINVNPELADEEDMIKHIEKFAKMGKNPMWANLYWKIKHPDDKGETARIEYRNDEIARDAEGIIEYLQQHLEEAGVCPVCGKPSLLSAEVCGNQEH